MSAALDLPPPYTLTGLYLAYLLDTGADHAIMPTKCASELARMGWLSSFDALITVPTFGWGFLLERSLIALQYPGADEIDPDTGRPSCAVLDEYIDACYLIAEG